ncbi:ITG-like peptide [Drosophila grimshawi]|uniref:GH20267 n=1 Tax=Drosophila grimshawi TaxID=7222 RepID=B4J5E0_DROGR|nr:ITG-like peptide [Drosophila grimshawi]EDW01782.1 GH20267 [Drosophila grimshawi]
MRSSIPVWAALAQLLLLVLATRLGTSASSTSAGDGTAWQRTLFGRNSRNLLHRGSAASPDVDVGGTFDMFASNLNNAGYNNEYAQLFAPYTMEQQQQQQQQQQPQQSKTPSLRQPQAEVYGIVEPLIEDTPCANRACLLNTDCCPTGVCVNTYGERKCVYVFGRQRDLCQRHADCAPGSACMLAPQEGIWRCEKESPVLQDVFSVRPKQPLGSECSSSSECQVINGMCCQQQRFHHRAASKLSCGYFRDAFDCVDVTQEHLPSVFQQRRN